jgi:multidrug transporter EmrE-like cation transporter
VGITYAVFTGIGTAGTAILDLVVFHEPTNIFKFISLIVLLIGIVGLKLTDKEASK